ncbi:MAG: hypothetical protein ABR607_02945 [Pyrinomonadaceae bacterium]
MKYRKVFSIALILGSLMWGLATPALGQPGGKRLVVTSGVLRLAPNQLLRITVNGQAGNDALMVQFRRMYYVGSANGGIWKTSNVTQDTTAQLALDANEAASTDISRGGFDAVSGDVIIRGYTGTTRVNEGVTFQIINSSTGEVVSAWKDADVVQI